MIRRELSPYDAIEIYWHSHTPLGQNRGHKHGAQGSPLQPRNPHRAVEARRPPQTLSRSDLARGVQLMYRRNKTNGTWVLKASDGHGTYWTKAIAEADDHDESNGKTILTFFEAQDVAKKLARGEDGSTGNAPITVDSALNAYRRDLIARNANPYNADWPRLHLTSVLLSKPVHCSQPPS